MTWLKNIKEPPWRTIVPGGLFLLFVLGGLFFWRPGLDVRDGRHDRGRNAIWLQHGWLGADDWFIRNQKTNTIPGFRQPGRLVELAARLRSHHITDVFPHVSPADRDGNLPPVDDEQTERFLDAFHGIRVIPWTGGVNGNHVLLSNREWRNNFARSIRKLLLVHPRLAGIQLNVEPLPSGDKNFLTLLEEVRQTLPVGKLLSIAAYPPPTRWHPYPDVHWEEAFFRQVAQRCDQLAVMMYDTSLRHPRLYQKLMADWTREVLAWSEGRQILLGLATYDDADSGYHDPKTENLINGLLGIHRGLSTPVPTNYQGVALYCEWEMDEAEWAGFRGRFLNPRFE
jgi:hypothetical protein